MEIVWWIGVLVRYLVHLAEDGDSPIQLEVDPIGRKEE